MASFKPVLPLFGLLGFALSGAAGFTTHKLSQAVEDKRRFEAQPLRIPGFVHWWNEHRRHVAAAAREPPAAVVL